MTTDDLTDLMPEGGDPAVFVDASGRRAVLIRRAVGIAMLGCLAYGGLLLVAALSGVPIQGAIVPYPNVGHAPSHGSSHDAGRTQVVPGAPASTRSGQVVVSRLGNDATPGPAVGAPSAPSAQPTPPAASGAPLPTSAATLAAHTSTGKAATAPGATNRPTSRPTQATARPGKP